MEYLEKNHLVKIIEEEYQQFARFYSDISQYLNLSLTNEEVHIIAYDRTYNMNNYIVCAVELRCSAGGFCCVALQWDVRIVRILDFAL